MSGEAVFRSVEKRVVRSVCALRQSVIATGGGVPLDDENVLHMRGSGLIMWLEATPEATLQRVGDLATRPLLACAADPANRIRSLLEERCDRYAAAADDRIDTTDRSAEDVSEEIVARFLERVESG